MPDVYVVDTGESEVYVIADDEFEAADKVKTLLELESINYAEWYSNDPDDADEGFGDG